MTATQHADWAKRFRADAHVHDVQAHLAAERDDGAAALSHLAERNDLLDLASHHEAQATAKRLAPLS